MANKNDIREFGKMVYNTARTSRAMKDKTYRDQTNLDFDMKLTFKTIKGGGPSERGTSVFLFTLGRIIGEVSAYKGDPLYT